MVYPVPIETAITEIESLLSESNCWGIAPSLSKRSIALLILQKDPTLWEILHKYPQQYQAIQKVVNQTQNQFSEPISSAIALSRQQIALNLEEETIIEPIQEKILLSEWWHKLTVYPLTGLPILLLILYLGVYKFVGQFGAGTLVDTIEGFFEEVINPTVNQLTNQLIPWPILQDLIAHDYGIITLGIRYAVAIVLPVVGTYFLMFSLLEDSGYLPRLSLMLDRLFKSIGLSGRAVIPIILGLGCDTMATLVTRTLETKRERLITVFLLALSIPCAAQWGVILGLLSHYPSALMIWGLIIFLIFLVVGYITDKMLPGNKANFYISLPPLRLPIFKNILKKTYLRMKWYFWEIIPIFMFASVLLWLGHLTGLFEVIIQGLQPITKILGLPPQAAPIFLYGFFRRDYGAAGLFDLQHQGFLNGNQLLVAAVVLTLFLPCIAQLQIMLKEQGIKVSLLIVCFVFPFAFSLGYIVNSLLTNLGINL